MCGFLGALHGCDCGSPPPIGSDAAGPVYDSGQTDAAVADAIAGDHASRDLLRPDAAVLDVSGMDSRSPDCAGADLAGRDTLAQDQRPPDATTFDAPLLDAAGNRAPSCEAIAEASVLPGGQTTVAATAVDPDPGDLLSYAWSAANLPSGVELTGTAGQILTVAVDR
ncbi:MAG: hypothetical protein JXR83_13800, partial [Deltaproteobacteria bacterium]|nr:hypothetical protein [Deltaproteobacteria bacterium]